MAFTLKVIRTINGTPKTLTWHGWPEDIRAELEQTVRDFRAGVIPMESTLTLHAGPPGVVQWSRSWRWADIKDIWIEEQP